jgi:hypothetical protein
MIRRARYHPNNIFLGIKFLIGGEGVLPPTNACTYDVYISI